MQHTESTASAQNYLKGPENIYKNIYRIFFRDIFSNDEKTSPYHIWSQTARVTTFFATCVFCCKWNFCCNRNFCCLWNFCCQWNFFAIGSFVTIGTFVTIGPFVIMASLTCELCWHCIISQRLCERYWLPLLMKKMLYIHIIMKPSTKH